MCRFVDSCDFDDFQHVLMRPAWCVQCLVEVYSKIAYLVHRLFPAVFSALSACCLSSFSCTTSASGAPLAFRSSCEGLSRIAELVALTSQCDVTGGVESAGCGKTLLSSHEFGRSWRAVYNSESRSGHDSTMLRSCC